ncbi:MAG: hypothetical protein PUP91_18675 [Rhizonema sp. PD37]|nr:hypothetical protein [Rhizonema sp. PD37]
MMDTDVADRMSTGIYDGEGEWELTDEEILGIAGGSLPTAQVAVWSIFIFRGTGVELPIHNRFCGDGNCRFPIC